MRVLYPWFEQARCWVRVAAGETDLAVSACQQLAERLRADELVSHEIFALHDLVRLGRPELAAARLTELASQVEGPLVGLLAAHAQAAAAADPVGLLDIAEQFGQYGLQLFGAEAAAAAVNRLLELRSPQATEATAVLERLRAACTEVQTPALTVHVGELSYRERQIAKLAASGVSSKEIAEQLFVSPRTVDNHLRRVYAKLGVRGRSQLASALRTLAMRTPDSPNRH